MFDKKNRTDSRVRVKICGITNATDATAAIDCGADALGFNFFPGSKRYIDVRSAAGWMERVPAAVTRIAILVNPTVTEAKIAASWPFIDGLQLHGDESPDFCRQLADAGIRFIKALAVDAQGMARGALDFCTDTVVLDTKSERGFGGTGETFSWTHGSRFAEEHPGLKVILAGGLTPENVAEAVRIVRPFGIDVTTGVESAPGRKDRVRLDAFFAALRGG